MSNIQLMNINSISTSGMHAQSQRMRIISENVANADSTGQTAGEDPYRRGTITFKSVFDRETGANKVEIAKIGQDGSDFPQKYEPSHPAADENGYVRMPNVNMIVELMDMRQAQRSYEANVMMMDGTRSMVRKTLEVMRG